MKRITAILLLMMVLISCSSNAVSNGAGIDREDVAKSELSGEDWIIETSYDRRPLYENETELQIIGRILTIEGCNNYYDDESAYGAPYTYGTLEVLKTLKGDVREGDILPYYLIGGTVSFDDYAKSQDQDSLEKQIRTSEENGLGIPENVTFKMSETQLEENKVYYIVTSDERNVHGNRYGIYPFDETFMVVDESSLDDDAIMGYSHEFNIWTDVTAIWFPENEADPRLKRQ